jgi:hypothetical protein
MAALSLESAATLFLTENRELETDYWVFYHLGFAYNRHDNQATLLRLILAATIPKPSD